MASKGKRAQKIEEDIREDYSASEAESEDGEDTGRATSAEESEEEESLNSQEGFGDEATDYLEGTERLAQNLKDVLLSGDLYDTVIKVQGQEFRTHKLILVIRSPVFASLLRHEDTEEENDAILVEDCDLEAFKVFLVFLYSGKLENVSVENVTGLYGVADKYRVEEVKLECVKFMMSHLSVENFCEFISLALRHGEGQLLERATDYFIENVKSVIVTVTWQSFHAEYPVESNELYIKAIAHLIPD